MNLAQGQKLLSKKAQNSQTPASVQIPNVNIFWFSYSSMVRNVLSLGVNKTKQMLQHLMHDLTFHGTSDK